MVLVWGIADDLPNSPKVLFINFSCPIVHLHADYAKENPVVKVF